MSKMENVIYVVTFLTFATLTKCQSNVVHFNIQKSNFGLKLSNSLIETKYDIHVLASCARECFYVTKCKSFNYNKMDGICLLNSLNSTEADVADFVEDGQYIYSDLTDWKKGVVLSCGEKPCSLKTKCIPYKPHACIPYCGDPNNIEHAVVDRGEVLVGTVRNYTCIPRHVPTSSDTSVTCQWNSEWTAPNFQCIAYCGNPNSVTNAVLGSGGVVEESVRTYTCIARHVPTNSDTSITCQSNSEWTNPNFQCIAYCGQPPIVTNSDVGSGGETLYQTRTYTCREPYTAFTSEMSITCQQSTYWSSPAFSCQLITTCQEVRNCNPTYGDGEYWLVLDNFDTTRRVKIHCNDMSGTPYETLTLSTSWRTWFKNPLGALHNGYYNDISINAKTLTLNNAYTETGTNKCMIGYGIISAHASCHMTNYEMSFYLENTGLWFNPIPTWIFAEGNEQSISVKNLPNKELEVSGSISWNYGYVKYTGTVTLQIDQNEVLPESAATKPQCP